MAEEEKDEMQPDITPGCALSRVRVAPRQVLRRHRGTQPTCFLLYPTTHSAMSLQGLMSSADCAVEVNPLHQVLKHTEGDRGVQQVNPRLSSISQMSY